MSSSTVPQNPTSHNVASLLPKLHDADCDIRFMTLNDLNSMLTNGNATFLAHDYTTCAKVVDGLLHTLNDTHGDVQQQALKCLGPFVNKAPEAILCPTIEKVSTIKTDSSIDTTIPALSLRAIVVALPHPVPGLPRSQKLLDAYNAVSKALIPRLVGRVVLALPKPGPPPPKGMLQEDLETGNDSNTLDVLEEVAKCFGPMLQDAEVDALQQITMTILEGERCGTVMKKKAVAALAALAPYFNDGLLSQHVSSTIEKLRQPHLTSQQRKLYLTVYGSLARSIPQQFGPYLKTLAPFVLSPLSQLELDQQRQAEQDAEGERDVAMEEVREAALVAIESFMKSCAQDMRAYTKDVVEACLRFLKYDPNVADDDDEEMEEEEEEDDEFAADEDFEEETGFDDEDDVSWKVRKSSAKALHAVVATLDPNDPAIYGQIAPALIARFKEREESVRNEVISTLAFLITKSGSSVASKRDEHVLQPQSRKRRRGFSDSLGSDLHAQQAVMNGYASPSTPPPVDNATKGLARINPDVVKAVSKLLKSSTVPTKQGVISLLKDMVKAQQGGLSESADLVIDPVVETMSGSAGPISNASGNVLRVEALGLLRAIAEMHSSKVIQPHLKKIIPALVAAAKDRFARVSTEAFATIEVYIKALTPPRSAASMTGDVLTKLYQVITNRISAQDTDTDVRRKAVQALGLLIGRTSGASASSLLSQDDRFAGQQLIADRLKNELTRLACVRAVDTIAVLAQSKKDFKPDFIEAASLELGAQLRKSDRALRGASLSALRMLAINSASRECISDKAVSELVELLVPLLGTQDLHMMAPALVVLAAFAKDRPALVAIPSVINGICTIVQSPLSGPALDSLITCVEAIGHAGAGQGLMSALLDVATQGDTDVTGQVIGTLLVSGGSSIGVGLDAFAEELEQTQESKRCLALSVMGEAGLRLGTTSPLPPSSFVPYFDDSSEKVKLAAAVALGRAGAGHVQNYLPSILNAMAQGRQYLLLHSVKELLQHNNAEDEIRPYTKKLWDNVIAFGQAEDNKVVGAEVIGRLAIIDPASYLPQLQSYLSNQNPIIRGMVISALRYVFSDTDSAYNGNVQASAVPMLATMLSEPLLENQRLALATFSGALQHKPDLVLPHLSELLPPVMQATVIRPELIREVQMGPFKHKVDDGLEMRKAAYESLYALLDSPASRARLDISTYYDRVVAGVGDEHEIKILCCLVLGKLINIAPTESQRRLDALAQQFRNVLAFKPKDTAVKQELEKLAEQQKAVVKVSVLFNKNFANESADGSRAWKDYSDWVRKDFTNLVKAAEDELRSSS
ncbi:Cullin-associated NEDD8-dissociated protein 1, C-terminal part [Fulvia fulva]|uniref:Cullin-associated NEDD8-dissociated protein 1, C-terminal part n=1 Tax=Passalora fulva TaxID=5499 RepID=A0A9Q8LB12_PASFU|nr:Cullin-associated NEDD8-dissociated protein 1, C-terminal part [Fulvia fulva]KAK4633592.1 Cullin-associated NEDD8-dissociated protein 1, C-terminal part [Fulvia fulva]UJO14196.1 Cullin-associated NEDD8-dissociated protein 1, C-terminal part [Fulvia fulva]WPV10811.1 Cullin-associated NEDD8-dissociated protein 1, C-terminal part [Fulvia fulva]